MFAVKLGVGAAVHVDRVCGNVRARNRVLEHIMMEAKYLPIRSIYSIPRFATGHNSKFERTMNKCIVMCDVDPFPKWLKFMLFRILRR